MQISFLKIKKNQQVIFLTLNRPEKRNALNPHLINELLSFFKKLKTSKGVKQDCVAVVLSGMGKAFCAGADLQWIKGGETSPRAKELEQLFSLLEAIEACPVPVVTMVHGFAVGGGLGLLAVSDIVIAEENTWFQFSETRLGLVPATITPFVVKKMGLSQSQFLMLSALRFSSQASKRLVHFIGSKKECENFLKILLSNIKELDPLALAETKKWLHSFSQTPRSLLKKKAVQVIYESAKRKSLKRKFLKRESAKRGSVKKQEKN